VEMTADSPSPLSTATKANGYLLICFLTIWY